METDVQKQSPDTNTLDLNITEAELLILVAKPLGDSEAYWETTKNLAKIREKNMNLWLPNHWKNKDYYDYQEEYLYQDPRVFLSIETACSILNARIAQPEVQPGQDTIIGHQLAKDLGDALTAHSKKYRVSDVFRVATRNLLLKRIGYIKPRWDPNAGKNGDIVPELVPPEDVVVDQDARWGDVPRFQAQKIRNKTAEELLAMFPEDDFPGATQAIAKAIGANRFDSKGNRVLYKSMLGRKCNIWEIWFRYWDTDKQNYGSGLAFIDENRQNVFAKTRNPNWNYDDESKGKASNLLDYPMPPFIPINYLNDGTSYIDLTSMAEQSEALQRVLDRRGFQIMENAEQAGSGLVFNTEMITKQDIAKLTGSPDERVGVKGDVRAAMSRIPTPLLPNYVIEDKLDARNEIKDVYAVHDQTIGKPTGSNTLGQDQMQQAQDYTRMDDIARAIERSVAYYYRYVAQMMKVYYTEDHWFMVTGEDGQFDHVMMRHDLIDDGTDISVEAGSTLPINKTKQTKFVQDLATIGMIDPLTVFEVGSGGVLPSPKTMLERFVTWKTNPTAFISSAQTDDFNRQAYMDIQLLLNGELPDLRDEIKPTYLQFFNNYMLSGDYNKQKQQIKNLFHQWLQIVQAQAQRELQAKMTQGPTQDEMNAAATQEATANQSAGMPPAGAPPMPPGGQPGAGPQPTPPSSGPQNAPMPPPKPTGAPAGPPPGLPPGPANLLAGRMVMAKGKP